jgi:hypothetical protein
LPSVYHAQTSQLAVISLIWGTEGNTSLNRSQI